jgi:hypothetical protein
MCKICTVYRCETWLVSADAEKMQSFINRCLRYICGIWWPKSHL